MKKVQILPPPQHVRLTDIHKDWVGMAQCLEDVLNSAEVAGFEFFNYVNGGCVVAECACGQTVGANYGIAHCCGSPTMFVAPLVESILGAENPAEMVSLLLLAGLRAQLRESALLKRLEELGAEE